MQVWSLSTGERLLTLSFAALPLTSIAVDASETLLAVGTSSGTIHLVGLFDRVRPLRIPSRPSNHHLSH